MAYEWIVEICTGLEVGKAQRVTGYSAAVIINAIIDQIEQEGRTKGGDESGPPVPN